MTAFSLSDLCILLLFGRTPSVNLVNLFTLRNPLTLFFVSLSLFTYAQTPPHALVHSVFVSGIPYDIQNEKIDVVDSDNVLIVLHRLPKGLHYQYTFNGGESAFLLDSMFLSLNKLKKGAHSLTIAVQPQGLEYQKEHLNVSVNDSFLKSWWFIPVLGFYLLLLLGAAIYFIGLINSRNKEKVMNLRSDWTNQLHNDIGGDLSSVALRLEILRKKLAEVDPKIFDNLSKIFNILNDIQRKLRFVFNLVDPKKDSLHVMFMGIYDFAQENSSVQGIKLTYSNKISAEENLKIDVGRINQLFLVLKEALNNVFKSAQATALSVEIQRVKEGIRIEIKDNGIGFDPQANHQGNGLKNLKQLAKDGYMDINIDSKPGAGTCMVILVYL